MSTQTLIAIGSGGFLGALFRAYLSSIINRNFEHTISFGTLGVNLTGSFLIGILFAFFQTVEVSPVIKSFLITGLLGAFTTYSTFAIESFWLLKSNLTLAIFNIFLNSIGSIVFAGLGYKLTLKIIL